jgi:hypothetical protein
LFSPGFEMALPASMKDASDPAMADALIGSL